MLWAGGGMEWESGVSRCKLLYLEWINNKVLLYSTGNYIQYPVINHNGKEYKNECMYIYIYTYITESLGYTAEINTTLYINYTSIKKKWMLWLQNTKCLIYLCLIYPIYSPQSFSKLPQLHLSTTLTLPMPEKFLKANKICLFLQIFPLPFKKKKNSLP